MQLLRKCDINKQKTKMDLTGNIYHLHTLLHLLDCKPIQVSMIQLLISMFYFHTWCLCLVNKCLCDALFSVVFPKVYSGIFVSFQKWNNHYLYKGLICDRTPLDH